MKEWIRNNPLVTFMLSQSHYSSWWLKIIWWEVIRVPFNVLIVLFILIGSAVAHINIPFLYVILWILINCLYCLTWFIEILDRPERKGVQTLIKYRASSFKHIILFGMFIISIVTIFTLLIGII